eukprot:4626844-Prymnesium_polylepis.1
MKTILRSETVIIPEGVTCEVRARIVIVKGPRGTLTKDLKHLPIDLEWTDESHTKLKVGRWFTSGKANSVIRTTCSHIENMIIGVTKVGRAHRLSPAGCSVGGERPLRQLRRGSGAARATGSSERPRGGWVGLRVCAPLQLAAAAELLSVRDAGEGSTMHRQRVVLLHGALACGADPPACGSHKSGLQQSLDSLLTPVGAARSSVAQGF